MDPIHLFELVIAMFLAIIVLHFAAHKLGLPPSVALLVGGASLAFLPGLPAIALEKRPDREARPGGTERPAAPGVERLRQALASQQAYASWLDAQLGVLMAALDRATLWETTVVVLAGDGGPYLWGHGMATRSDLLFDETLHAPLIVAEDPRTDLPSALGRRVEAAIEGLDPRIVRGWLEAADR